MTIVLTLFVAQMIVWQAELYANLFSSRHSEGTRRSSGSLIFNLSPDAIIIGFDPRGQSTRTERCKVRTSSALRISSLVLLRLPLQAIAPTAEHIVATDRNSAVRMDIT